MALEDSAGHGSSQIFGEVANGNIPREMLGHWPTPLYRAERLGELLGIEELWIKRDDLSGFSLGGNKIRAAEFLLGEALAIGATELVLAGGPSSNFVAVMAAAGRSRGLDVHLICYGDEPDYRVAALTAFRRSGGRVTFTHSHDRDQLNYLADEVARERLLDGVIAYPIPRGGATEVGAIGFAMGALECVWQLEQAQIQSPTIVLPVGSGGSAAGLLAGLRLADRPLCTVGVSVSRPAAELRSSLLDVAAECCGLLGATESAEAIGEHFTLEDGRGEGFGRPSKAEIDLGHEVHMQTGIMVDPTYNMKTLAWMSHAQELAAPVVYWHTGGLYGVIDHNFLNDPEMDTE